MSLVELQTENDRLRGEVEKASTRLAYYEAARENVALSAKLRDTRRIEIVEACASTFSVTSDQIMSRARTEPVAHARQLAMTVVIEAEGGQRQAYADAGRFFGRDMETVYYAIRAVEARKSWPDQKKKIEMVRLMFGLGE